MSVVASLGFRAAGVASGIKPDGRDLAVVVADRPAAAAGVFAQNQAAAAPVLVSRSHLLIDGTASAVVINSGCANAGTGTAGHADAQAMTAAVAESIGVSSDGVLVCSTGTIGPRLPMDHVLGGIAQALAGVSNDESAGTAAADAIRTTDSVTKEATFTGEGWTVGGMAKGSGMVRPNMATMLACITTDAAVEGETLSEALVEAVDRSFNSLNIDGCESTNDSVIVLASGASNVAPDPSAFAAGLTAVCQDLALQMARDAEGATRVVTIDITGAATETEARALGRLVTDSALVRSSFYGGDVNWGRVLGALGTAPAPIDIDDVVISYEGVTVFAEGAQATFDEPSLLESCETGDFALGVVVGDGQGTAHIVTTDLTPEYVIFNGERS
ncbi:MAG: bifunctional glutamate N-acetyltransferase/amino-acid acetyltransferase ArgJ [Acidimicrobiia bacterium]